MINNKIIVIGASTGGVNVLKQIVKDLPPNLDASIFIVWHMSPDLRGILPEVLNKLNTIVALSPSDKDTILPNRIYVAPPDHHMLIEGDLIRITRGPKENRFRPAVDPLFRSAAHSHGKLVIGVILTGALDDGTAGLWRIKFNGGLTIVQDPADAEVSSMPESALREVEIDYCVATTELAPLLVRLCHENMENVMEPITDDKTQIEIDIAAEKNALEIGVMDLGILSPFACPDCHGVLTKIKEGKIIRFRCHTGHAYSADTLMAVLSEKIEDSMYEAIRGSEETIMLLNNLGDHYADENQTKIASVYFKKAKEAEAFSKVLLKLVHNYEPLSKNRLLDEAENE